MDSDSLIRAEFKQRRFLVEHVNRKSALFPFNMPRGFQCYVSSVL